MVWVLYLWKEILHVYHPCLQTSCIKLQIIHYLQNIDFGRCIGTQLLLAFHDWLFKFRYQWNSMSFIPCMTLINFWHWWYPMSLIPCVSFNNFETSSTLWLLFHACRLLYLGSAALHDSYFMHVVNLVLKSIGPMIEGLKVLDKWCPISRSPIVNVSRVHCNCTKFEP